MNYLLAGVGLVLLFVGARLLIRGASTLGFLAGISPIVVGLTVVAYGTSTPELVVSVTGSWTGHLELALGNVVGSNIFNVLFILGVSALLVPLVVNQRLLMYDVPLIIGLSLVTFMLSLNGWLSLWEGGLLCGALILYTGWAVVESRTEDPEIQQEYAREYASDREFGFYRSLLLAGFLFLLGLLLLIGGSQLFTRAATGIARTFGVSEMVIGLTIVSAGTSLPEVGTSLLAAYRGQTDIAVGNVIGSNLFNLTGVLGLSVLASGQGLPISNAVLEFDLLILILVSLLCLPIFFTGHRISRWEGFLFVVYYGAYLLSTAGSQVHPLVSRSLVYGLYVFVIPLTAITVGIGLYRYS